jgi:hypothetical protein
LGDLAQITHETGSIADIYDITVVESGRLSLTSAAAMGRDSKKGLQVAVDGGVVAAQYGRASLSAESKSISCKVWFDPNGMDTGTSDFVNLVTLLDGGTVKGTINCTINAGPTYTVNGSLVDDSPAARLTSSFAMTNAPHEIEIRIKSGSGDGSIKIYEDGVLKDTKSGYTNVTHDFDRIEVGVQSVAAGTTGTAYLDEVFVSNNSDGIFDMPITLITAQYMGFRRRY